MIVVDAEADGPALARHGGEADDRTLGRLAVDLGQHHVRLVAGEGAFAPDRRQLAGIAEHEDRLVVVLEGTNLVGVGVGRGHGGGPGTYAEGEEPRHDKSSSKHQSSPIPVWRNLIHTSGSSPCPEWDSERARLIHFIDAPGGSRRDRLDRPCRS